MIRTTSSKQLTIAEFDWPFDTALDKHNRWVKLSACIPWDALAEFYYQGFAADRGRPMKEARLVIGAVIIKHKLCLSDVETVQQIQENPYLQFFVGLPGYQTTEPFAASLFVEIRKRMGEAVFEGFHRAIIAAHEGQKSVTARATGTARTVHRIPSQRRVCAGLQSGSLVNHFTRGHCAARGSRVQHHSNRYPDSSRPIDRRRHRGGTSHSLPH